MAGASSSVLLGEGMPYQPRYPVAAVAMGQHRQLVVVCSDGTAWMWGVAVSVQEKLEPAQRMMAETSAAFAATLPHAWVQFHMPIPGSLAHAEYAR